MLSLHCSHCSLMGDLFSKEQGWRGVPVGRHEQQVARIQGYCKPPDMCELGPCSSVWAVQDRHCTAIVIWVEVTGKWLG